MKLRLVNTPLSEGKFLEHLKDVWKGEGQVGFDTESVAPLLRGRRNQFINVTHSALLGLSIAFEDETCYYLPVRHKGNNTSASTLARTWKALTLLAGKGRLWAHNAKWDHQVALREGVALEGLQDSMVAAWLQTGRNSGIGLKDLALEILGRGSPAFFQMQDKTGKEVLEYACHDALNTLQLGAFFTKDWDAKQWDWFRTECRFAHSLAEMKLLGVGLDADKLTGIAEQARAEQSAVLREWDTLAPGISISSAKQLQVLFDEGQWRSEKMTRTGQNSTARNAMLYQIENETPGKRLAELRLHFQEVSKILGTYTEGLIEEAYQWADKRLHPDLHHFGTVTGRLSSSNPNIQNQPSHGKYAEAIKSCYIPSPGMAFTSADYSQVELRYFADYCGGKLLEAFLEGADLHQVTADALGVERSVGKTINFGFLLYGGGPQKMADLIRTDFMGAKRAIAKLQRQYPEIEQWRQFVIEKTLARATILPMVRTKAGRIRYIPELNPEAFMANLPDGQQEKMWADMAAKYDLSPQMDRERLKKSVFSRGKRLVVNYLVQGGCRDILVLGMDKYRREAPKGFRLVTTVHDEVLTEHPIGKEKEAQEFLKYALESVGKDLKLRVPLIAEPKSGSDWSKVK